MWKIDAHTHVGDGAAKWSGKDVVARMDTIGIDKTVIFPFTEGFFNNDLIMPYYHENPDRLIPFCAVNPWEREKATAELEKCFKEGFMGVKLHPTICGYRLSDKKLVDPIFDLAQTYGKVVIVHGASDLNNCPLEFDRMARRFPKVPLIMAHCGFFWQWDLAAELGQENDNLYFDTSRVPLFETKQVLRKVGASKMMWGTDGPFADYEWEFEKIKRAAENEIEFDQIMGGTISGLLNL